MADSVIYVSFKDTFSDKNPDSLKIAAEHLADQILAAAKRIEQDKKAIYDYVRQDTVVLMDEVKPVIPTSIVKFQTSSIPLPKKNDEKEMIEQALSQFERVRDETKRVVTYLVENAGLPLSIKDIAEGSGRTYGATTGWLNGTAKQCKAITCVGEGVYKFNPDLL